MQRPSIVLAIAAALFSVGGTATAHHSYASFDRCQQIALEGDIERILWANPHVVLTVKTAEGAQYLIEWSSLAGLVQNNVDQVLATGDRVAITGALHRDPNMKIMTLLTEIRRPSDDWHWSRRLATECAR